jgi:hypothetical protein
MKARVLALLLCAFAGFAQAQVCADPQKPCAGFKSNDLSFPLPNDGVARAESRSVPFYAIMLRTAKLCSIQEKEQQGIQVLFPRNKVFYTRFECDGDAENNVFYTNVSNKFAFIAVYAGVNRETGEALLEDVNAMGLFPGANLRRMQAVFVSP